MRRHLWWVLGLVLVGSGLAIALTTQTVPDDVGWFAYTPLSESPDWFMGMPDPGTASSGPVWFVSRWQVVGIVGAVVGLLVIGSGVGYRLGRRRGPAPQQS